MLNGNSFAVPGRAETPSGNRITTFAPGIADVAAAVPLPSLCVRSRRHRFRAEPGTIATPLGAVYNAGR